MVQVKEVDKTWLDGWRNWIELLVEIQTISIVGI